MLECYKKFLRQFLKEIQNDSNVLWWYISKEFSTNLKKNCKYNLGYSCKLAEKTGDIDFA